MSAKKSPTKLQPVSVKFNDEDLPLIAAFDQMEKESGRKRNFIIRMAVRRIVAEYAREGPRVLDPIKVQGLGPVEPHKP